MTKESVTKVENMEWLDGHYTGEVSDGVPHGQGEFDRNQPVEYHSGTKGSDVDVADEFLHQTWSAISAPTLLLYGADSWASNPEGDGRLDHFSNAEVIEFENAGHWLHHDQFDRFMKTIRDFL